MSFSDTVWERRGGVDTLSERAYIAAVTLFTVYGLGLSSIVSYMTMGWQPQSLWLYLGVGLGIPIVGIIIAFKSDEWLISLFGLTLVVCGMGAIVGPAVGMLESGVVMNALLSTAGVTVVMSFAGIAYPRLLIGFGGYLFGALVALVFVRFGQVVMASMGISSELYDMPFVDYGAAVLFSLYIIYDWNRALNINRTLDNAVDSAVALYLDIINLFITLLRIYARGQSSNSD